MEERELSKFELKMSFRRISYIAPHPHSRHLLTKTPYISPARNGDVSILEEI